MEWYFIALIIASCTALMLLVIGTVVFFRMAVMKEKGKDRTGENSAWNREDFSALHDPNLLPYKDEISGGRKYAMDHATEIFKIKSYDDIELCARLVPSECEKMRGIILMVHGFRSNPLHDFSCAVRVFTSLGFSCVMPDMRAHGESGGDHICFGAKEKYDVKSWCEFFDAKYPGVPVILDGISMGATSVLMASGLDLPENVKGIIADCGFISPIEIWKCVCASRFGISPFPFVYTTSLAAYLIAGFKTRESTLKALEKNDLPILFAHGKEDTFVPCAMSVMNYEEAIKHCDCELFTVQNAEHGLSFLVDREGYLEALERLFAKCL